MKYDATRWDCDCNPRPLPHYSPQYGDKLQMKQPVDYLFCLNNVCNDTVMFYHEAVRMCSLAVSSIRTLSCVATHHFTLPSAEIQQELSHPVVWGHSETLEGVAEEWLGDRVVLCLRHHWEALLIVDNQPAVQPLIQAACVRTETHFNAKTDSV